METLILFIPSELWSDLRAHQENVHKVSDIGHDYRSEKLRISVPSYGIRWCFCFFVFFSVIYNVQHKLIYYFLFLHQNGQVCAAFRWAETPSETAVVEAKVNKTCCEEL